MTLTSLLRLTNFLALGILLVLFPTPAHAQIGDLILLHTKIDLVIPEIGVSWEYAKNVTMLKEGYMLSLDSLWFPPAPPFEHVRIANFTIFKNGETVKKISANQGDVFYHNKIIDGKEYTIIEAKVEGIYLGTQTILVRLEPFYQYSDGSTVNEKGISAANSKASIDAAPSEEWNRTFGGKDEDAIMSVQQTGDGGYFLARSIPALWMGLSGTLIGLNKTDAGGNEQWNKTIFEYGAQVHSIQQTADDGFAVAGDIISTDTLDAWLVKIDSNGSKQWKKTFGGGEYGEAAYSVSQTGEGGYILAGSTGEYGKGIWLIRMDSNGNEKWNRILETTGMVSSVQQTADGGYIMAMETESDFPDYYDAKLIKVDSNGSEQWNRKFGGKYNDRFYSVRQTRDGGYILAGMTESYGHDAWLIKTDPKGNEQWNRTFYVAGGSEALDVQQTHDGYILAGRRISYEGNDALLIKTDSNGIEQWRKIFGGERDDEVSYVHQTGDGGYILAGNTKSFGSGDKEAWLIKVSREPDGKANAQAEGITGTASPNQTLATVQPETNKITPAEKAAGFEMVLAITTLLAVYIAGRKGW